MSLSKTDLYWVVFRVVVGFVLLWAFLDKLFGFGYSTPSQSSWLNGGSPTSGFLKSLTGPFSSVFNSMANMPVIDWVFMLGLLYVGLSLILGLWVKYASIAGIAMMTLMWLALFPSKTNPIVDDHIIYILAFLGFILYDAGKNWSLENLLKKKQL